MHADTGDKPTMCPWRAFADPFVGAVIDAYPLFESGQLSLALGADPPWVIMRGVLHYDRTIKRMHANEMERERKRRDSASAVPPNAVFVGRG